VIPRFDTIGYGTDQHIYEEPIKEINNRTPEKKTDELYVSLQAII